MMNSGVTGQLELARKKLLDISLRNRLINYKTSRTVGAEVASGEMADHIFELLIVKGKALKFLGQPDVKKDEEESRIPPKQHVPVADDEILTCKETVTLLGKKLLKTFRDQRTLMEETGVNTLFLAIGRLNWVDTTTKNGERSSPLILVPVSLERKSENNIYQLSWDGQDVLPNLPLGALFKDQFSLVLPELELGEEILPSQAFKQLENLAAARGWMIDPDAMSLAFFSSAKYLMFADLDPRLWENNLDEHPDLQVLLSPDPDTVYAQPDDVLRVSSLDAIRPVEACTEVVDCDGSQLLALMQAARGKTMVIEGPPGTGKSQTITNLLADCVARGKTVLFVSEKLAALNVVARNLERVGLRSLCLELHSHNTNKLRFYKNLEATLLAGPAPQTSPFPRQDLQRIRDGLNAYAEAVNRTVAGFGLTPREVMGELLKLGEDLTEGKRLPPNQASCPTEELVIRREIAASLDRWVKANGKPQDHPFHFVTRFLDPIERQELLAKLQTLLTALDAREGAAQAASDLIQVPEHDDSLRIRRLQSALEAIGERPALHGLQFRPATEASAPQVREILEAGCRWATLQAEWGKILKPEPGPQDLDGLHASWESCRTSRFRWFMPRFYRARKQIDSLSVALRLENDDRRTAALLAARENRDLVAQIQAGKPLLTSVFEGEDWSPTSPWRERLAAWEWFARSDDAVRQAYLPPSFFEQPLQLDPASVRQKLQDLRATDEAVSKATTDCEEKGAQIPPVAPTALRQTLTQALAVPGKLGDWVAYWEMESRLPGLGMPGLVDFARTGAPLDQVVARSFYEKAINAAYTDPVLKSFSLAAQETQLESFRTLDRGLLQANRERIKAKHQAELPRGGSAGGVGIIQREAQKQRSHKSIRSTLHSAWPAIQKIKPIFMMSPVSVAMYLDPKGPRFDVVIFDEASQVRPEEAMGAIARASQAIVVGDTKQMPPTSFFERMTQDLEPEDDEVEEATAGLESILDVVSSRIPKTSPCRKDLRWHYRSRHETLITPSNGLFYDWRLFIVPNPAPPDGDIGLRTHILPQAVYDRGKSRTNMGEANAVVDAIIDNLRHRPHESLMAVAFSVAQQTAIQDVLDLRLGKEPGLLAAYQAKHPTEPVDIKNLENVQGDERDVVLISIGYGRDADGYITQAFGPLNQDGGGRRLNVLITRARKRCEVFTNMEPEDVRPEGNEGRKALRTFLTYARSGHMDVPEVTGREPMSVFEEQVIKALTAEGFTCEPQVGVAGFYIDIGVRHPEDPGRFCLGIECDGAQYHSSATARDRDRLRQSVLESRGWHLHRVWSTDWFSDPKGCLARAVSAIHAAIEARPPVVEPPVSEPEPEPVVVESAPPLLPALSRLALPPYQLAKPATVVLWDYDWMLANQGQVKQAMAEIVVVEAPIQGQEVVKRLREAASGGRAGSRISALLDTLMAAVFAPDCRFVDGWFVPVSGRATPRDRSGNPAAPRLSELIHDSEIRAAIRELLAAEVVMPRAHIPREAFRLLGIGRVSQDSSNRIDAILQDGLAQGWLEETSAGIRVRS